MPSDDDPLTGADVGETRTIREQQLISLAGDRQPRVFWDGRDRSADAEVVDVEVVDTADGLALEVEWEGQVTKELPANWDYCKEPRTEVERRREEKRQWQKKWSRRVSLGIGFLIPAVVATFVTNSIMSRVAGQGPFEEVGAPGLGEIAGMVALLMLFAAFVMWALQRLPRPGPGRSSL